jgi:1,4-dihydroxy-2-naphthoate octaprenyltransferase
MRLRDFLHIVELRTKVVGLSSFLLGTLFAVHADGSFSLADFVLMLIATLCVDMGTTAFNSFFDANRGVDNRRFNLEDDKVIVHGGVAPGIALIISVVLFFGAAVFGLILALRTSLWLIPVGGVSLAVGYLYNAGPLPISRTPFGELFAGGFLGSVLFLVSYFVQAGEVSSDAALASLPSLLFVASILTVNNTCDIEGDRAAGRTTLSILLGVKLAEIAVYVLGFASFVALSVLSLAGPLPALGLFFILPAAVFVLVLYRGMHQRGYSHSTKGPQMNAVVRAFGFYTLSYLLSVLLGIFFS